MPGYDFIGDVHGQFEALSLLLKKLGYTETNGVFRHSERIAVFVGDLIDRGPQVRKTLHTVRKMCENGSAMAIMGNHEYNLICYLTRNPTGSFLREHNEKNRSQVQITLDSFKGRETELENFKNWLLTLPLFLDLRAIRVVHACWDHMAISHFWCSDSRLNEKMLHQSALSPNSPLGTAVRTLLKGKKINLPDGLSFIDSQGYHRTEKRLRWWENPREKTYMELLVLPMYNLNGDPDLLQQKATFSDGFPSFYSQKEEPVVFGHYWLSGKPTLLRDNILCVDYGAGAGEKLVAYRWSGEDKFNNKNWVINNI